MEVVQVRILRPGDVVTVHCCAGAYSELPPELPEGSKVTVLAVDYGYAEVQDETGQQFTVAFPQVDMPRSIWWQGEWVDRFTHPEGERAWQWVIRSD